MVNDLISQLEPQSAHSQHARGLSVDLANDKALEVSGPSLVQPEVRPGSAADRVTEPRLLLALGDIA